MPIVDVRNIPTVVEFAPDNKVVEFTEEAVTAEVVVGPTVVEFSWGELVPEPGLSGGGVFEGRVYIRPDIPTLPLNSEPVDPEADYIMLYDASGDQHVKVLAQLGAGGIGEIPWATREETDAGVLTDKALNPDVGAYAYDRFRHVGQHTAGKGTETVMVVPDSGAVTINGALSNVFYVNLTSDVTFANPVNPVNGQTINIHLKQNVVGGWDVTTWGSQWTFTNKINPTLSPAPNAHDMLSCQWNEIDGKMHCSFLPNYGAGFADPPPPAASDLVFVNVGGGNEAYRNTVGLNVNFRTFTAEGDLGVRTEGDQIIYSYTAPVAVDYTPVPFLIVGDPAEYPSLLYARQIVAGTGIAVDTITDGAFTISSDLVPIPPGGTTAQVLSKLSDTEYDVAWVDSASGSFNSPMTTKGDLITRTATEDVRLPVGTNGQILSADSAEATGLKWIVAPTGGGGGDGATTGGGLVFVKETVVTGAAASTMVVSGLNLDADGIYVVILRAKSATASAVTLALYYNSDTTPTNYFSSIASNGTSTQANNANLTGMFASTASEALIQLTIGRVVDRVLATGIPALGTNSSANTRSQTNTHQWTTTGVNVTSITINSSVASGLDIGSKVQVYKLTANMGASGAEVSRSTTQSFSSGVDADVEFDTEERDTDGYWSIVNPNRFTIPADGFYTISGYFRYNAGEAGGITIGKNGSAEYIGNSASSTFACDTSYTGYFQANDYVTLRGGSSTASTILAGARFSILRHAGVQGPVGPRGDMALSTKDRIRKQDADLTLISNTTFTDSDLQFDLVAGRLYAFDIFAHYLCHATPDFRSRITYTGTGETVSQTQSVINGSSSFFGNMNTVFDEVGTATTTAQHTSRWFGLFKPTTDGTVKYQIAQVTSAVNPITLYAGSYMRLTDITDINENSIDVEVAADSPRGYWKFDEAAGNFADSSGNGYTATVSGTAVTQYQFTALNPDFPSRKAAYIGGASQNTNRVSPGTLGLTAPLLDWTYEFFGVVAANGTMAGYGADGETAATNAAYIIDVNSTGTLQMFWEYGSGTNGPIFTSLLGGLLDGRKHHIAITKNSTTRTVAFYIDGSYAGGGTYTAGQEATDGTSGVLDIGASRMTAGVGCDGIYALVAHYTTALSESRIQAHARALGVFS